MKNIDDDGKTEKKNLALNFSEIVVQERENFASKKQKKELKLLQSAHGETRTPKDITPTASETATFTNFATWAALLAPFTIPIAIGIATWAGVQRY